MVAPLPVTHRAGCPADRDESFVSDFDTGRWQITRCQRCGEQSQVQLSQPAKPRAPLADRSPSEIAGGSRYPAVAEMGEVTMRRATPSDVAMRNGR